MNNEMTTDNMSNEEVIEVLKGIVFNSFDITTRKERQALDLAIKALEGKIWIPTSEILPEEYDSYLVMWRSLTKGFPDRLFYEICEYDPDEDEWERIEQAGEAGAEIVAWMPLPERYEPKEKEK